MRAVAEWLDGEQEDDRPAWDFEEQLVRVRLPGPFSMWRSWSEHGTLPRAGGWSGQRMRDLALLASIDLVVTTYRQKSAGKMELWSETQSALVRWING